MTGRPMSDHDGPSRAASVRSAIDTPRRGRPRVRVRMRALLQRGAVIGILAILPVTAFAEPPALPAPLGLVSDFAQVIDARTEATLTARLREVQQKTGAEIAVVTITSSAPDDIFDYAIRLAEAWKPGARDKDNGVVFLTAVADRKMHILTGYGIEGALPDGLVGQIRDRAILPQFRSGDYGAGIAAGVDQLTIAIAREYRVTLDGTPISSPRPRRRAKRGTDGIPFLLLLLVLFVIVPNMRGLRSRGRRRRGLWMAPMWGTGFGGGGFGGRGGGFGGGLGGGFGGFGGGGFGGGGAGGSW